VANWCFNEPTHNFANSSVLAWPAVPKAGFYGIKEACRPVLAGARVPRFQWGHEMFQAELWLLNDTWQQHAPVKISAEIEIGDKTLPGLVWSTPPIGPNQNARGPVLQIELPSVPVTEFFLVLRVSDRPEWNSRYRLRFHDDPKWQFQEKPSFTGGLDLTEGKTILGESPE
jgi:beta-mannosidase